MTGGDIPKTPERPRAPFHMGDLEVFPASGEVRGPKGTTRIRPLLMEILLRLATLPGAVVRRETLLEEVWPRRMVNDEVLSRAIAELRTALGDDAKAARYIETLPKIGYRLATAVRPLEPTPSRPQAPQAPQGAAPVVHGTRRTRGRRFAIGFAVVACVAAAAYLARDRPPANAALEAAIAGARIFTSDPVLEIGPRFSPDGRTVAFVLGEGDFSRVVLQSIEDSTRRTVGSGRELLLFPVFFPDGKRIAFWRRTSGECEIVEHTLATGAERRLLDCTLSPRPRFDISPDGARLVFSGQTHPHKPAGLWTLDLAGGAAAALTTPEAGMGDDLFPRFNGDGRRIAFFRGNESHRQPWIVALGGERAARRIGSVEGLSYGVAWLGRDGPLLAAADWVRFRALHVIDPDTGVMRLLGARGARFPDVGPAGEIVWEHAEYSANLWLAAPGAQPRELWRTTRYSSQPEFSPDGEHVTFASNRDGTDAIYVARLDGAPKRIAFGDTWRYLRPHWSADGRFVHAVRAPLAKAGSARQEGVRIPVDGGAAQVLALEGPVADVRESPGGRWLYWGVASANAMTLWRAPREDPGKAERLALPAVSQYQVNAHWIVFAQPQLTRLTACRADTLACAPLPPELGPGDLYHWSIGPRSLFLRVREGNGAGVARFDLATGKRVGFLPVAPSGAGMSVAPSPDESTLVFAREEGPTVDLMLAR